MSLTTMESKHQELKKDFWKDKLNLSTDFSKNKLNTKILWELKSDNWVTFENVAEKAKKALMYMEKEVWETRTKYEKYLSIDWYDWKEWWFQNEEWKNVKNKFEKLRTILNDESSRNKWQETKNLSWYASTSSIVESFVTELSLNKQLELNIMQNEFEAALEKEKKEEFWTQENMLILWSSSARRMSNINHWHNYSGAFSWSSWSTKQIVNRYNKLKGYIKEAKPPIKTTFNVLWLNDAKRIWKWHTDDKIKSTLEEWCINPVKEMIKHQIENWIIPIISLPNIDVLWEGVYKNKIKHLEILKELLIGLKASYPEIEFYPKLKESNKAEEWNDTDKIEWLVLASDNTHYDKDSYNAIAQWLTDTFFTHPEKTVGNNIAVEEKENLKIDDKFWKWDAELQKLVTKNRRGNLALSEKNFKSEVFNKLVNDIIKDVEWMWSIDLAKLKEECTGIEWSDNLFANARYIQYMVAMSNELTLWNPKVMLWILMRESKWILDPKDRGWWDGPFQFVSSTAKSFVKKVNNPI